jgi:glycosyltransferase involved in cell wall biosynthesis
LRKTLLLFTGSYPYDVVAENGFIPQEIDVLRRYFETIQLIPCKTGDSRERITAPNVTVRTDYATFRGSRLRRLLFILRSVMDRRFLRELSFRPAMFLLEPRAFVSALRQHVIARMTERWIRRLSGVSWADAVLYTWWFDGTTLGLATFGGRSGVPVITRAHGSDLYEHRQSPEYIPFRKLSLERVKLVFSASEAGARHLASRYPSAREKVRVSLLGVSDPGFVSRPSTDGVLRIVSCSVCLPVKRIDLLIRGIAALGRAEPQRQVEWTHIGDGPDKESLASLAAATMPANVRHRMLAYPGSSGLFDFYRSQPVDLFINTSKSEGTPVTIMEAISVGIPVIATAVGGNVEIVTEENGAVIPANAEPGEIADAITRLMRDTTRLSRLRSGSRAKWEREYAATRNYTNFARTIREL